MDSGRVRETNPFPEYHPQAEFTSAEEFDLPGSPAMRASLGAAPMAAQEKAIAEAKALAEE